MEKAVRLTMYDVLQQFKTEINRDLRVCLPGKIAAVNESSGTVDVTIVLMQRLFKVGSPLGVPHAYPLLPNCPVFSVQGGGVGSVMPTKVGDECFVLFSDRAINTWFETGKITALPSTRMHNIADGLVLVGLNSLANPLNTPLDTGEGGLCETNNAFGAKVAVNPLTHKITIANGTQDLFTILTSLINALAALNTAIASTSPTNIASAQAIAVTNEVAITAVQTALTALLY